jgi:hypothetical protein
MAASRRPSTSRSSSTRTRSSTRRGSRAALMAPARPRFGGSRRRGLWPPPDFEDVADRLADPGQVEADRSDEACRQPGRIPVGLGHRVPGDPFPSCPRREQGRLAKAGVRNDARQPPTRPEVEEMLEPRPTNHTGRQLRRHGGDQDRWPVAVTPSWPLAFSPGHAAEHNVAGTGRSGRGCQMRYCRRDLSSTQTFDRNVAARRARE